MRMTVYLPTTIVSTLPGSHRIVTGYYKLPIYCTSPAVFSGRWKPMVMTTTQEYMVAHKFTYVLLFSNLRRVRPAEITSVNNDIILAYHSVEGTYQGVIHFVYTGEWPVTVLNNLSMSVVLVCCESNMSLLTNLLPVSHVCTILIICGALYLSSHRVVRRRKVSMYVT
jgi:hypothetical protein